MCKSKQDIKDMLYGRALRFADEIGCEDFFEAIEQMRSMIDVEELRAYAEQMEDRWREVMHTRQSFEMVEDRLIREGVEECKKLMGGEDGKI